MARSYGAMRGRGAGNNQRRRAAPAETQEVYLPALTFSLAVQCAAEFGLSVDELMDEAMLAHIPRKAAELFEREFFEAKMEADQDNQPSVKRWEFEKVYRKPSWAKDTGAKDTEHRQQRFDV